VLRGHERLREKANLGIVAVIFDIGGVLKLEPGLGWYEEWQQRTGLSLAELDQQLNSRGMNGILGTCTEEEWASELAVIAGFSSEQGARFMRDLWSWHLGEINKQLMEFFVALRPRMRTALLSNNYVGARIREEEKYKLSEITDLIVYSYEEGLAKPDPQIYEIACRRLEVQPNQAIFLDDRAENVTAANNLGMRGILFSGTSQAIDQINDCINREE